MDMPVNLFLGKEKTALRNFSGILSGKPLAFYSSQRPLRPLRKIFAFFA